LVTLEGRKIQLKNTVRYLGVYLVSAKMFTCALDNAKKSFNCRPEIGKIGSAATERVVAEAAKKLNVYRYYCMAWKFVHLANPK